jgi:hypothetical protein
VTGIPALLAGLFAMESHPLAGILIILASMALLLSSLAELCRATGLDEPNLRGKLKENVYGG